MKTQLLDLQKQIDSLRSKLQSKSRTKQFDKEWEDGHKTLKHLDGLFSRLCKSNNFELNKFGRLI